MVLLDSMHTHDHVLAELEAYNEFVTPGSYLVVFDTTCQLWDEETLDRMAKDYVFKPWGKDSNPHSALIEFLGQNKNFEVDEDYYLKSLISNSYDGFLKRKD